LLLAGIRDEDAAHAPRSNPMPPASSDAADGSGNK
jgi:hypothetical protein